MNKESQKINGNYKKEAHGWISKYNMWNRLLSEQNSRLDSAEKRICGPEYGSLEIIYLEKQRKILRNIGHTSVISGEISHGLMYK